MPEKRRFASKSLCFFAPFSGVSLNGKQCLCGHRPQTPLVGARPKPGSFGPCWPEVIASLRSLFLIPSTLHFFLFCRLRVAQQTVDVRLDCQNLLHIPPGFLVLPIEPLFLCGQLSPFLFLRLHLRELCPSKKPPHISLRRPVEFYIRLILSSSP